MIPKKENTYRVEDETETKLILTVLYYCLGKFIDTIYVYTLGYNN